MIIICRSEYHNFSPNWKFFWKAYQQALARPQKPLSNFYLYAILLWHLSVFSDHWSDKDVFRRTFSSHDLGNRCLWIVLDVLYHQAHQGETSWCPNVVGRNPPTNVMDLDDGKLHALGDDIVSDLGIRILCHCMDLWLWNYGSYLPEFHSLDDLCSDQDWIGVLSRGHWKHPRRPHSYWSHVSNYWISLAWPKHL